MSRRRVAILISGGGSNMLALARAMARSDHPGVPCLVLSDRVEADGLVQAEALGLETICLDRPGFGSDTAAFEAALQHALSAAGADIVCLAGFMRVLSPEFLSPWMGQMLNIHPSLLPLFPGLDTHARAITAGVAVHGCTVHEVTPEVDTGPILGQAVVPVLTDDTPASLAKRVLAMEHRLYPAVLERFANGSRSKYALLA
jgi:phosphoribosylglycinamide formyltransferase-1